MSGGGGGPIIIRRLAISDPTSLGESSIAKLRDIAERARYGGALTLPEKLYVAYQALRSLRH